MDHRTNVLVIARGRIVLGLTMLLLPGVALRIMLGRDASTATSRVLARMFGAREVALGVGTVTSVKEHTQDAEWASASAVADAVDGLALAFSPGVPARCRPAALIGASSALLGMQAARAFADERAAEQIDSALAETN
jgi:hypothetical protein